MSKKKVLDFDETVKEFCEANPVIEEPSEPLQASTSASVLISLRLPSFLSCVLFFTFLLVVYLANGSFHASSLYYTFYMLT